MKVMLDAHNVIRPNSSARSEWRERERETENNKCGKKKIDTIRDNARFRLIPMCMWLQQRRVVLTRMRSSPDQTRMHCSVGMFSLTTSSLYFDLFAFIIIILYTSADTTSISLVVVVVAVQQYAVLQHRPRPTR